MSSTTKKIIALIKQQTAPFTAQTITAQPSEKLKRKKPGRNRKGKRERAGIVFDHETIHEIIRVLHGMGLLVRNKNKYSTRTGFAIKGKISLNASGNGTLSADNGIELTIPREYSGNALHHDTVTAEIIDIRRGGLVGAVTTIASRGKERYVAVVEQSSPERIMLRLLDHPGDRLVYAKPSPDLRTGDGVLASIPATPPARGFDGLVQGRFPLDSPARDFDRIVIRHSLPGPHERSAETDKEPAAPAKSDLRGRKDYRGSLVITIDGEHAKDFDDALSLEVRDDVRILAVHIADVSHFVRPGTPLDREAYRRGTSFYLGDRVIPMLPESLSNGLCSLKEKSDRLTMTAEITINGAGSVIDARFFTSVIRVSRRLTYTGAHEILHGPGRSKIKNLLAGLHALSETLRKNRMAGGSIELNLPDEEAVYDGDTVADIRFSPRFSSHQIVEECMLLANQVVSRALRDRGIPTLYRVHEPIAEEKLIILKKFLQTLGLRLERGKTPGIMLQNIIDAVSGTELEQVVSFIVLKSMMQAYYGEQPLGHFGLGFDDYTHFTSPIRRYPDLIVHRCLKALLDNGPRPYTDEDLRAIGEQSSIMERVAQRAERDFNKLKSCRYMAPRTGETFSAIVSGISPIGFYVTLLDRPIEGMVPLFALTDDYYLVMENEFTVIGRRRGKRYAMGDRITVRLESVDIEKMRIDFTVAS